MKVLLFADPPAGDQFVQRLQKASPVIEVEYVRNPHPKRIVVRRGFDWVIGMNLRGMGAQVKDAARAAGARFVTVPPSWAQGRQALEDAGVFSQVAVEEAAKATAAAPPPAPVKAPSGPPKARTWSEPATVPQKAAEPVPEAAPAPEEPRTLLGVTMAPAAEATPVARPLTPGEALDRKLAVLAAARPRALAVNAGYSKARYDWVVYYLRHNPWAQPAKVRAAVKRRFGIGIGSDALAAARSEAKASGALPPAAEFPADPLAVVPDPRLVAAEAPPVPPNPVAYAPEAVSGADALSADSEAAVSLLREALRREPNLASFTLSFANGVLDVSWNRAVQAYRTGSLTIREGQS